MSIQDRLDAVLRQKVTVWFDFEPDGPTISVTGTLYPTGGQYFVTDLHGGSADFKPDQVSDVFPSVVPDPDSVAQIYLKVPTLVLDKQG